MANIPFPSAIKNTFPFFILYMYITYAYDYVQTLYFTCQKCFDSLNPDTCYLPDTEILDRYFLLMKAQMSLLFFKETTLKSLPPEKCEKIMQTLQEDYETALSSGLKTYYDRFQCDSDWWKAKMTEADKMNIRYKMDAIYCDLRARVRYLWEIKEMAPLTLYKLFEDSFQSLRNQEIPPNKWNQAIYHDFCLRMEWEKQQIQRFNPFNYPEHFHPQPDEEYQQEKQRYTPLPSLKPLSPSGRCIADYWQGAAEILDDLIAQCISKNYLPSNTNAQTLFPLTWNGPKTIFYDLLIQCGRKGYIKRYFHIDIMKHCVEYFRLTGVPTDLASKYSATICKRPPKGKRIEVS